MLDIMISFAPIIQTQKDSVHFSCLNILDIAEVNDCVSMPTLDLDVAERALANAEQLWLLVNISHRLICS